MNNAGWPVQQDAPQMVSVTMVDWLERRKQ